jgi:hypothetical protein
VTRFLVSRPRSRDTVLKPIGHLPNSKLGRYAGVIERLLRQRRKATVVNEPSDEGKEPDEFDLDVQIHPPAGASAQDSPLAAKAPSEFACPSDDCPTGPGDNRGLAGDCIPTDLYCETEPCTVDCKINTGDCTVGDQCLTLDCWTHNCTHEDCPTQDNCPTREDCPHATQVNCRIE